MHFTRQRAVLAFLAILVFTTACGMSAGQTITLYLGGVTVLERRLQADAEDIQKQLQVTDSSQTKLAELASKLTKVSANIKAGKAELEKMTVPAECEAIHKSYISAFDTTLARVDTAADLLKGNLSSQQKNADLLKLKELQKKAAELDEEIRLAKVALAEKYPEVQVPEALAPEANNQQSAIH